MNNDSSIMCVCCKRTFDWSNANNCPYCGTSTFNYCTNTDCEMCPSNVHYEENWTLKWNFKFCPECGSKSTFHDFLEESDLPQNGQ